MSETKQNNQTQQSSFILASGSPQRKTLLEKLGIDLTIVKPNYSEQPNVHLAPELLVKQLAEDKYAQLLSLPDHSWKKTHDNPWILTADTLVFYQSQPLGKPSTRKEAQAFLELLSGKNHQVVSGVYLQSPQATVFHFAITTQVRFLELNAHQIEWYLTTEEWNDAAGGYRIQGAGGALVSEIQGSFSNVIGLPLAEIYGILSRHNFWM